MEPSFLVPLAVLIMENSISLFLDNRPVNVDRSHPKFEEIKEKLENSDYEGLQDLISAVHKLHSDFKKLNFIGDTSLELDLDADVVTLNGFPIADALSDRLIADIKAGRPVDNFARFVENLMQNPSKRAVTEFYGFLEKCQLPLTSDGHFIAYKKVRGDLTDIYSGKFDNSPGQVLEMPRNAVDEDRDRTCSTGFHFCSWTYLQYFGNSHSDTVLALKINPRDVVSIPSDYNDAKGRACRYEVISVVDDDSWKETDVLATANPDDYGLNDSEAWDFEDEDDDDEDDDFIWG